MINTSVLLNKVCFAYNSSDNFNIINNVSLSCNSSEILAIVGPSGCGKTTLVKLIIGAKKATHGDITLFGYNNYHDIRKYASIPGPNLGYMPQEDSLPTDFRVYDCLHFFAILCKMNKSQIKQRIHEVLRDLNLFDEQSNYIWTLSGGMKRRLSLAIAILHKPQLLVLDEPTVAADPLIRTKMWKLFNEIKANGTTIILTTHYMDECKYADAICFMKDGQVMTIERSESLIQSTGSGNLDQAYKKFYQLDNPIAAKNLPHKPSTTIDKPRRVNSQKISLLFSVKIFLLLMYRYGHLFLFTPLSLMTLLGSPTFNLWFSVMNHGDFKQLQIGITIEDQGNYSFSEPLKQLNITPKCLQCIYPSHFIDFIDLNKFGITYYDSLDDALKDVEKHKIWASLYINDRFVEAHFQKLTSDWSLLNEGIIKSSKIDFTVDASNNLVYIPIEAYLTDAYRKYWKSSKANLSLKSISTFPFEYMNSVIDNKKPEDENGLKHSEIASTLNMLINGMFVVAGLGLISELENNCLERFLSVGLEAHQIYFSQLTIFTIFMTFSGIFAYFNLSVLVDMQPKASLINPFIVFIMSNILFALFGQLFALVSMSRINLLVFCILSGLFYIFGQDGVVSLEAYPYYYRDFSKYLPFYAPLRSIRSSILYGHSLSHPNVYLGYVCNIVYISILLPLVYFKFKAKI